MPVCYAHGREGFLLLKPIIWLTIALAAGIALAELIRLHPVLPMAGLLFLFPFCIRWPRLFLVGMVLAGALLHGAHSIFGAGTAVHWAGQPVSLTAKVVAVPAEQRYQVKVETVNGTPASGTVRVFQVKGALPPYGAVISVKGKLTNRHGQLRLSTSRVQVVREPGFHPTVWLRQRLDRALKEGLPEREAALMAGLLYGSRAELPEEWIEAFRQTGVYHVLAVSGGNVMMILFFLPWLERRVGRRSASLIAIPLAVLYWGLTGGEPSVSRATIMIVVTLLGRGLGRDTSPFASLSAAVFLLLWLDSSLLFHIGFQLSIAATLGILLFTDTIDRWLRAKLYLPGWLAAPLAVTLAAQVAAEPLTLHYFGAVSPIAPIANLPVGLLLGGLVPAGAIGSLIAPFFPSVLLLLLPFLKALVFVVEALAQVPGAFFTVPPMPWLGVLLWYMGLALLYLPSPSRRVLAAGMAAAMVMRWTTAYAAPPGELRVTFIDVGQGDAVLVQSPEGRAMLVDAGPASLDWNAGEARVLPVLRRLGVTRLAYAVVTHGDQDHAGGMAAVLTQVPAEVLLDPTFPEADPSAGYEQLLGLDIKRRRPLPGQMFRLGTATVEVLWPPARPIFGTHSDENANSIVVRVRYGRTAVLLTGDIEPEAEEELLKRRAPVQADVLKVAHHGSARSSQSRFLKAVGARIAVVSTGPNQFGHPDKGVLKRLKAANANVYRTDLHGTVTVASDGQAIRVATERRAPASPGTRLVGRSLIGAW